MDFTDEELRRLLKLRAIEWVNWPSFLSQAVAPLLICVYGVIRVVITLLTLEIIWAFMRYAVRSFKLARVFAVIIAIVHWPVALTGCIWLVWHHRYVESLVALLWPILCSFIQIPGQRGQIELGFATDIGYVNQHDDTVNNPI